MKERKGCLVGILVLILLIVLIVPVNSIPGWDLPFYLIAGWIEFIGATAPKVHVWWQLIITGMIFCAALVVGAHFFIRWLYREMNKSSAPPAVWRFRWTLAGFALVALMFAAGTAAIGIIHQTAWLVRSKEPMFTYGDRYERANRVKCRSNLQQIGQGLMLYAQAHGGQYPDDLRPLILEDDVSAEVFVCPSTNQEKATGDSPQEIAEKAITKKHCSYIYVGKGLRNPVDRNYIVAYEPPENHDGDGMNILFGDGHVEWYSPAGAEQLLKGIDAQRPTTLAIPTTKP